MADRNYSVEIRHKPISRDDLLEVAGGTVSDGLTTSGVVESPLFTLPPELRNEIYRFSLPTGTSFEITTGFDCPTEPPLLCTSRQIRDETILIYYQENEWIFPIEHLDATTYITWSRASPWRIAADIRFVFSCVRAHVAVLEQNGGIHFQRWTTLHRWLEAYYRGECVGILASEVKKEVFRGARQLSTAAELFEMVKNLRDDHGLHWPEVEALLENVHQALAFSNSVWN